MEKLILNLNGPIKLLDNNKNIFNSEFTEINKPGIYFWTVKVEQKYLLNYVGISAKSILDRLQEHIQLYLSGNYTFYNTDLLKQGILKEVYSPNNNYEIFLSNIENYSFQIINNLKVFEIFFVPIIKERYFLELLESEIILHNRKNNTNGNKFLTNYRLSRLKTSELNIKVEFKTSVNISYLPNLIEL